MFTISSPCNQSLRLTSKEERIHRWLAEQPTSSSIPPKNGTRRHCHSVDPSVCKCQNTQARKPQTRIKQNSVFGYPITRSCSWQNSSGKALQLSNKQTTVSHTQVIDTFLSLSSRTAAAAVISEDCGLCHMHTVQH